MRYIAAGTWRKVGHSEVMTEPTKFLQYKLDIFRVSGGGGRGTCSHTEQHLYYSLQAKAKAILPSKGKNSTQPALPMW